MITRKDFPEGFLFGAATSAYQIEGHSFGGAGPTIWDTFAAEQGRVANGETGAIACGHYHRYEADLDLLNGLDAYRFSTSWARVMPDGKAVNQAGLDFYDRLVDAILARDLKPFLTLYHWDMPAALGALGGWENRDIARWFGDFTDIIMDRIGDRVAFTATINEPWCVSWLSHFLGHHAPGKTDIPAAALSVHHVLLAHGEAMQRLRARGQKNLGIVLNFEAFQPACPQDTPAARRFDAIMNRMFIEPLTTGQYPALLLAGIAPHLPEGWQDDMALISAPLDWLGVNYYTRQTIAEAEGPWPHYKTTQTDAPKTRMGWDIYPEGLRETLGWLSAEFTEDLPLFVTENGMAWEDAPENGTVSDSARSRYLFDHLAQVKAAMKDGANVQGYFYWSLLDNYEWAFGYEKRFGMIYVDFETQERTPKNSFYAFKAWLVA